LSLRQLPNTLCVLRMLLVVPIVWLIARGQYAATLLTFAAAAVSDGLDGLLAKRFGWTTELGKVLDPIADKLLLVATYVTLAAVGLVPVWLAGLVVLRDVVIALGAATYRWLYGPLHGRPTRVSKLNTLCQILYVLAVVAAAAAGWPSGWVLTTLGALTFVTTVVSGADYVLQYSRRAADASRPQRA
jgi:cardiolipin synthase